MGLDFPTLIEKIVVSKKEKKYTVDSRAEKRVKNKLALLDLSPQL